MPFSDLTTPTALLFFLSPKFIGILIGLVLLYSIAPIAIAFTAIGLAQLFGCDGGVQITCPNPEMGNLFTSMTVAHWLALFTLPTGLPVAGVLVIIWVLRMIMLQRR